MKTLVISKDKSLHRELNKRFNKISSGVWVGISTSREIETIKSMILLENVDKTLFFNVSTKDIENIFKKTIDFLGE